MAREGARTLRLGEHDVIVAEPAMIRLFGLIERVACSSVTVLVTGETGTGKEIVTEALHAMSPRVHKPLVKLNCAAVPEALLESELFGYEKGAFSGADKAKAGLFEMADGGTLLLDEIGEMAPAAQAKLLRVLEDHRVRRLGGTVEKKVDVRIVAATHKDLRAASEDGSFRRDLFYRLSNVTLRVPPLRERPREIPLLAERFAVEAAREAGREPLSIGAGAMQLLCSYHWPGNLRELRNVIGSAVFACDAVIEARSMPPELGGGGDAPEDDFKEEQTDVDAMGKLSLEEELREVQRRHIIEALLECGGNQTKAAELLRMPRRTLVHKISALEIDVPKRRRISRDTL